MRPQAAKRSPPSTLSGRRTSVGFCWPLVGRSWWLHFAYRSHRAGFSNNHICKKKKKKKKVSSEGRLALLHLSLLVLYRGYNLLPCIFSSTDRVTPYAANAQHRGSGQYVVRATLRPLFEDYFQYCTRRLLRLYAASYTRLLPHHGQGSLLWLSELRLLFS